jgi:tetratricopeptide (TPR) repeat protein
LKRILTSILFLLAAFCVVQAQTPEAIEFYRKGYDLLHAQNFRNAAIELEKATQADATYGAPFYALAQSYKFLDEYDKAITAYKTAKELGIKPDRISTELGKLYHKSGVKSYKQRKFAEAISHLENALAYAPDNAKAHYTIGHSYKRMNNPDAAANAYSAAIKADAKFLKAYIALGDLHLRSRNFGPAADVYNRAIEVDTTAASAYGGLAKVQIETQDIEGAVKTLNKALEVDKKYTQGFLLLGTSLNLLGRQHEAIDPLLRAVELDGKNAEIHYRLSEAYYGKAEYTSAVESGKRATSKRKNYHAAQVAVGDAYAKLGQLTEARTWYNRAKDDNFFKDYCLHRLEELNRQDKKSRGR